MLFDNRLQIVIAVLSMASVVTPAFSGEGDPSVQSIRAADVGSGSLLVRSDRSTGFPRAPALETRVKIRVTGMIGRTRVVQKFRNETDEWQEGVYVFPLPERAAVDSLHMVIGERVIEGEIRERGEARKTYEQAKAQGKKASLVEQERPNIFTTSVAQIGPAEEVEIQIEYQEDLRYDQGSFELRFPMVVGPRYIPRSSAPGIAASSPPRESFAGFAGTGWAKPTDVVPDADRITPPVVHPSQEWTNRVDLEVDLDPGFALSRLESPSHPVRVEPLAGFERRVVPSAGTMAADRDFVLRWTPEVGTAPDAALFSETLGGEEYLLLMLVPPHVESARLPREVLFVIDTSGSMEGTSILQARQALSMALQRLVPEDLFNVIQFNSSTSMLFSAPVPAGRANVAKAESYVLGLKANGGTAVMSALAAAFSQASAVEDKRVRQVVFVTDGAVGNEQQLFSFIRSGLGDRRLFTVGIGSAPNSHFMSRAAQFGRGTFTYVGSTDEVSSRMGELFQKLECPVLSSIEVDFGGGNAELWPAQVPDLYAGEPIVVTARATTRPASVSVRGLRGDEVWNVALPLGGGAARSGVEKLWARRKIASLMDRLSDGADPGGVRTDVIAVALGHHLVSKYTSLVAVDVTPTAPAGSPVTRPVPTQLPAGWSYEATVGALPQTATAAEPLGLSGLALLLLGLFLVLGRSRCHRDVSSASR
jgi:Ca-activated chloride channel homolog